MLISSRIPLEHIRIIATDIDERVLEVVKEGVYSQEAVLPVLDDLLRRRFERDTGGYRVKDEIHACVELGKLDLLLQDSPHGCNLVVCRNVLIYFTFEGKDIIFRKFADCLVGGGCLFMGRTEQIVNWKSSSFPRANPFYIRRD